MRYRSRLYIKGESRLKGKGILIILVVAIVLGFIMISPYNSLVALDEEAEGAWAQVENQLKRRADLIPNLIEVVKGFASQEEEILSNIAEARTQYQGANTPEEYAEAEENLNTAVRNLNVIVENYPELKSNELFQDLQAELAGTENRIATERMRYNEVIQTYNGRIRRFPTNLIAGIFGFDQRQYFEISESDAEVPEVEF